MDRKLGAAAAAPSVRGHTCAVCGEIGNHFEDHCPAKPLVHMPEVLRQQLREEAVVIALGSGHHPAYLAASELVPMLRVRPDVPPCLMCMACCRLAEGAVWCRTCDAVCCSACLAPVDEPWLCPQCGSVDEDNFHVVGPVRGAIDAWLRHAAATVDAQTMYQTQ
jgi:hypothetical protein